MALAEQGGRGFDGELDRQAMRVILPGCLFTVLVWLPYLWVDRALHPELPQLLWIRLGLIVASLVALMVHRWAPNLLRPQLRMLLPYAYMQAASGFIAGLLGGDASYVGGWLGVLMVAPSLPLSRARALGSHVVALLLFAVGTSVSLAPIPVRSYPILNVAIVSIAVPFLVVLLDGVRRRSWQKSLRIDALLHNILPSPIVRELKATDRVEPRLHEEVTVLFTDFVGFTTIAEQLPAAELLAELDRCFSGFDGVVERRGLERLKTIGDSYMAAAGVPNPRPTHCADALLAGLDITRLIHAWAAARTETGRPYWEVRVGIHTGPLVAGVVGKTRFAYDVWGDTVNLASRMESAGSPGRVNISAATAEKVSHLFVLEHRGQVPAKNKGIIDMYFVVGIRPELSVDGGGIEPNAAFWAGAGR